MNVKPTHPAPTVSAANPSRLRPHFRLPRSAFRVRASAFTLIEILVVVSIIAILLAVVGGFWAGARDSAQTRVVRVSLSQLAGTATEYGVQTRQVVPYTGGYNNTDLTMDFGSIQAFVTAVKDNARPAYDMLQAVNESLRVDTNSDGELDRVIDNWGQFIRYYPGTEAGATDQTGIGLPLRKQPYFASAGPDMLWGSISGANEPNDAAADNLYSFEID